MKIQITKIIQNSSFRGLVMCGLPEIVKKLANVNVSCFWGAQKLRKSENSRI